MADKNPEFGKRLEYMMKSAGFSKKKLADTIGASPSAIGTYIKEGRIPEAPILYKIAQSLKKSMEELLTGELPVMTTYSDAVKEPPAEYTSMPPRVQALIEKLTLIYNEGTFEEQSKLRGAIENIIDDIKARKKEEEERESRSFQGKESKQKSA
ncbi:MAG: putative HTH-type transcriptional regulator ImmR [Nitrospirae bacterium]|nr:MAG: putative HTH-type transcriptional regulator ImmR [Nitrospirota bacterium]